MIEIKVKEHETTVMIKGVTDEVMAELATGIASFLRSISKGDKEKFECFKAVLLVSLLDNMTYEHCREAMRKNEKSD